MSGRFQGIAWDGPGHTLDCFDFVTQKAYQKRREGCESVGNRTHDLPLRSDIAYGERMAVQPWSAVPRFVGLLFRRVIVQRNRKQCDGKGRTADAKMSERSR